MNMDGKVALVTGAGRGFGWGIAQAFARAGAQVAITDIDPDGIDRTVGDARAAGADVAGYELDIADLGQAQQVVDDVVGRWGRLDVAVHNAIFMPLIAFEDLTPESWWRQLNVGLGGLYNTTKAAWPAMTRQGGGHVIGIASGSSVRGYHDEVAYCTIKHAQEGFVKALAIESRTRRIAVNTMGPGKAIKPTRLTWDELAAVPEEEKATWHDPADLGRAFVWLALQPPDRFNGLRFDAGSIIDTLDAEGEGFAFAVEKVTRYAEDFKARRAWLAEYPPS